jgi:hypothetical protein
MIEERRSDVRSEVAAGVTDAFDSFLADKEKVKKLGKLVFDEVVEHTQNGTSQWIGKRLLTAFITALVGACLVYLVRTGAVK